MDSSQYRLVPGWLKNGKKLNKTLDDIFYFLEKTGIENLKEYLKHDPEHTETIKIETFKKNKEKANYIKILRVPGVGNHFTVNGDYFSKQEENLTYELTRSYSVFFDPIYDTKELGSSPFSVVPIFLEPLKYIIKDKTVYKQLKSIIADDHIKDKIFSEDSFIYIAGIYGNKEVFILNTFTTDANMKFCLGPTYLVTKIGSVEVPYKMFNSPDQDILKTLNIELGINTKQENNENILENIYNKITERILFKDIY